MVLLRNENALLPLATGTSVAVIGEFARTPRYQGAGSSHIIPTRLDNALDAIREAAAGEVAFAPGFVLEGVDVAGSDLVAEAVAAATAADVAVVFLGLPDADESEGFDRDDIELPADQVALLDAVVAANPRTVVVLANGGVVRLAGVVDRVPAVLEGWLLGQAGGSAVADVLYGAVNPSGRLAETVPVRLQDTPAYLDFPGEHGHVRYGEGLFVGYRWYDARDVAVSFPFGHGLSYTTFDYADLAVTAEADEFVVRVTVSNTGDRDGHEVVQVYASLPGSSVVRAPRELVAFERVWVAAGESVPVELRVARDDLAYYDTRVGGWVVESGEYVVEVGASSRDLRGRATVTVEGDDVVRTGDGRHAGRRGAGGPGARSRAAPGARPVPRRRGRRPAQGGGLVPDRSDRQLPRRGHHAGPARRAVVRARGGRTLARPRRREANFGHARWSEVAWRRQSEQSEQVPKISRVCVTSRNPCSALTASAQRSTVGPSTSTVRPQDRQTRWWWCAPVLHRR